MPTILTHAVVAAAMSIPFRNATDYRKIVITGIVCSMLPDADSIGYFAGVPYHSMWGHRGITHSFFFAILTGLICTLTQRSSIKEYKPIELFIFYTLCTASHPVLDAVTNGGLGVAFFAPFLDQRYFFPFRPVLVSPMGSGFISTRGLAVLASEFCWIWLPALFSAFLFLRLWPAKQR